MLSDQGLWCLHILGPSCQGFNKNSGAMKWRYGCFYPWVLYVLFWWTLGGPWRKRLCVWIMLSDQGLCCLHILRPSTQDGHKNSWRYGCFYPWVLYLLFWRKLAGPWRERILWIMLSYQGLCCLHLLRPSFQGCHKNSGAMKSRYGCFFPSGNYYSGEN